jgi:hypothetical protein
MLGDRDFFARLHAVREKGVAPDKFLFTECGYLPGLQTTLGTGHRFP